MNINYKIKINIKNILLLLNKKFEIIKPKCSNLQNIR